MEEDDRMDMAEFIEYLHNMTALMVKKYMGRN